jgi:hypothetical protein
MERGRADHTGRRMAAVAETGLFPVAAVVGRGRFRSRSRFGRGPIRRNSNATTPFDFYSPPWSAVGWADMRRKRHEEKVSTQRETSGAHAAMQYDGAGRYLYR